jgi:hypothetical protein
MFIKKLQFKKDKWTVNYGSEIESGAKVTTKLPEYVQKRFDSLEEIYRQLFKNDYLVFRGYQYREGTKKKPSEVRIKFETSLSTIPVACGGSHFFGKADEIVKNQLLANENYEALERYELATKASELITEINNFCLDNIEAICVVGEYQNVLI